MSFEDYVTEFRDVLGNGDLTATTSNATATYSNGALVTLSDGNVVPGGSATIELWLKPVTPDRIPTAMRVPGIQESDQYLIGRCVNPRILPDEIQPLHETPITVNGVAGTFIWLNNIDPNFSVADIVGERVNGWFRIS